MRSRRTYRAPVVVDVQESSELSTDPADVFVSRRERMEAERGRSTRRKRVVVKPARAPRVRPDRQRPVRERPVVERAVVERPVAEREVRRVARPESAAAAHPPRGMFRRVHAPNGKRMGFQAVVLLALAAFFGTAALPAYATSAEGSYVGNARTALAVQTLTAGNAAAQVISRDGLQIAESPQMLDATTNNGVSPSVQALAVQLMGAVAAGRLVGYTPDHIPEIANLAEGKVVPNCGVDYRVLQSISVALEHFSQVGVSDINRRCTGQIEGAGTSSAHYADGGGHAVDFYLLNGSALTGGDQQSLELIRILDPLVPNGAGLGQAECRSSISVQNFKPFDDTCNHVHIDFLNADAPTLKGN
jgi:hypothetical protein